MDGEPEIQEVIDVLGSEESRDIIALATLETVSSQELEERLETSLATVYRRTQELSECEFLTEETEITGDGNHYTAFETNVHRITFTVEDGEFRMNLEYREDTVDRFGRLWRSLGGPQS